MNEELLPPKHLINYSKNTSMFWSSAIHAKFPFRFSAPDPPQIPGLRNWELRARQRFRRLIGEHGLTHELIIWVPGTSPGGVAGEDGTQVPLSGYQNKYATYILFSWTTYQLERTNPFLLILNVPQIQKTGVHLQFQKISDWPMRLLIDPL